MDVAQSRADSTTMSARLPELTLQQHIAYSIIVIVYIINQ